MSTIFPKNRCSEDFTTAEPINLILSFFFTDSNEFPIRFVHTNRISFSVATKNIRLTTFSLYSSS